MKLKDREAYENQYLRLCAETKSEINTDIFRMEDIDLIGQINKLLEKAGCVLFDHTDNFLFK